jgi:hypothetical protein
MSQRKPHSGSSAISTSPIRLLVVGSHPGNSTPVSPCRRGADRGDLRWSAAAARLRPARRGRSRSSRSTWSAAGCSCWCGWSGPGSGMASCTGCSGAACAGWPSTATGWRGRSPRRSSRSAMRGGRAAEAAGPSPNDGRPGLLRRTGSRAARTRGSCSRTRSGNGGRRPTGSPGPRPSGRVGTGTLRTARTRLHPARPGRG